MLIALKQKDTYGTEGLSRPRGLRTTMKNIFFLCNTEIPSYKMARGPRQNIPMTLEL